MKKFLALVCTLAFVCALNFGVGGCKDSGTKDKKTSTATVTVIVPNTTTTPVLVPATTTVTRTASN